MIAPLRRRRRAATADADSELLARLRAGDEDAFVTLVGRHQAAMLRLARSFVASPAIAEEVVQDTWLAVLRGIERFEGRSTIKTWLLQILVNRARTTGVREQRTVAAPSVDPERFDASGAWSQPPQHWADESDDRLLAQTLALPLQAALEALPERQRQVVLLRDVEGLDSVEVCAVLALSEANQRVLLHRARSSLRAALEVELG
jgi:RNA polymerase sigma-70 factor (ECF subfamily)